MLLDEHYCCFIDKKNGEYVYFDPFGKIYN
jgi:hypothetical protein